MITDDESNHKFKVEKDMDTDGSNNINKNQDSLLDDVEQAVGVDARAELK